MRRIAFLSVLMLFAFGLSSPSASKTDADSTWLQKLTAWRAKHEQELTQPNSWFSLVALDWLKAGANSVGSAPDNVIRLKAGAPAHLCVITIAGNSVQLTAPAGGFVSGFTLGGKPAHEIVLNLDNPAHASLVMSWGDLSMRVISRGDRFALRISDAKSPDLAGFHNLRWYAPDPSYRVTARWTPYQPMHNVKIATVVGTMLDLPVPGVAEFRLKDMTYQLEPVLESGESNELFFLLRDETSHSATYGAGRFLYTELPDHGLANPGSLMVDFNRLENPPCAYTPYATCPLPPKQNLLRVAIEAGEKRYHP